MTIEPTPALRERIVDAIRFLAIDGVEQAKSGHPGAPMGLAAAAFELWSGHLRFDPSDPTWPLRDRFVLSNGHASMLLYSLLHLFGFNVSLDDLRRFRQLDSRTPGHPEFGHTPGVETTTGPLGQGFANGVGMALGQKLIQARFPSLGPLLDHRIFALVSDGDLMEGVSAEAAALAGHWKLGNLVYLYDDNRISIEGPTALAWSEDVARRFEAYGWGTSRADGHAREAVDAAIAAAVADTGRPSLILARTVIGKGAPTKEGTAKTHGEPLGRTSSAARRKPRDGRSIRPSSFRTTSGRTPRGSRRRSARAPPPGARASRTRAARRPRRPPAGMRTGRARSRTTSTSGSPPPARRARRSPRAPGRGR